MSYLIRKKDLLDLSRKIEGGKKPWSVISSELVFSDVQPQQELSSEDSRDGCNDIVFVF